MSQANHTDDVVHMDETLKTTIDNKGTKGFSLNPGAVSKHYLRAEYRTMYLRELRDVIGLGGSKPPEETELSKLAHTDLQRSRTEKARQMSSIWLT